ncbi:MAG: hypothetical protein PHQ96_01105 [Candidatus Omnitrophica bacterium]|nr:hypothetical protein [Candidatus Omnitrophota bacterium]
MRKKGLLSCLMVLASCFLFSNYSYPTPTTHIWAPSTDVQKYGVMHVTSDLYLASERDSQGARPDTITNLGLTAGILPFSKLNMELGFDHKSGLGDLDDYPIYFNAKIGVPEDSFGKLFPALAIGIYDIGTEHNKTDNNVFYAKGAKTIAVKDFSLGRFSAGYFQGNSRLLLNGSGEKDNNGLFAAWERSIPEISDRLWLCAEYMGTKSSYGAWSYGFSWKFSDAVCAIAGYNRYNNSNLADTVTLQIDIDFDLFSKFLKNK